MSRIDDIMAVLLAVITLVNLPYGMYLLLRIIWKEVSLLF